MQWAAENRLQIITHANDEHAADLLIATHGASQTRIPDGNSLRLVLSCGWLLAGIPSRSRV